MWRAFQTPLRQTAWTDGSVTVIQVGPRFIRIVHGENPVPTQHRELDDAKANRNPIRRGP